MLPNIFGADFGDKIHCFIFLTDPKHNQFEVLFLQWFVLFLQSLEGAEGFLRDWIGCMDHVGFCWTRTVCNCREG